MAPLAFPGEAWSIAAHMQRIQVLPPEVAERIAAGEVIERPSSVIKELVENSLDALATEITVSVENGGKSLLEVLDNGRGMSKDDLALSIQRHATSKLQTLEDLENLGTLGFRGEALPSIAAVSELSLVSRAEGAEQAFELTKNPAGGFGAPLPVTFGHFLGKPHGTRIRAESLFAQVPARLKFLRSDTAEVSQIRDWLERLALAHPAVGFRLISHDKTLLQFRPETEEERVRSVLGDGENYPIRMASSERGGISLRVYWFEGLAIPHTRKLAQVVNGRSIRDRLVQQAMLSPFRQALLPGRFPAAVLFLKMNPGAIDVNVHPTKAEVRFLNQSQIFHEIQKLVESLVVKHGTPAFVPSSASPAWTASSGAEAPASSPTPSWSVHEQNEMILTRPSMARTPEESKAAAPEGSNAPLWHLLSGSRFAGALFNTYLLFDRGEELILVDQHAADERIRYEKLRRQVFTKGALPDSQQLLIPEIVAFAGEQRTDLEKRFGWIERIGFQVELFGEGSVVFRAVPAAWGQNSLKPRLKSLVERVLEVETENEISFDESLFERLASEACHSAVRAGDRLEPEESEALALSLTRCEHPWNCPHGRPTVVRIPRGRLEEWFQRRV